MGQSRQHKSVYQHLRQPRGRINRDKQQTGARKAGMFSRSLRYSRHAVDIVVDLELLRVQV